MFFLDVRRMNHRDLKNAFNLFEIWVNCVKNQLTTEANGPSDSRSLCPVGPLDAEGLHWRTLSGDACDYQELIMS